MFRKVLFFIVIMSVQNLCVAQVSFLQNRENINLTEWSFRKGRLNYAEKFSVMENDWEKVKVPHTYSMDAIEDIGYYKGDAWYRTLVEVPASMAQERIFIRFEGVGQEAQVFVNEKRIGKHVGGYSAFCFEITDLVKHGQKNLIAVKVNNSPNFKRIPVDDNLFNHYGGIYRPVTIFSTPKYNISPQHQASSGVFVELKGLDKKTAKLEIRTHVSNTSDQKKAQLKYTIKDAKGKKVLSFVESLDQSEPNHMVSSTFEIKKPVLWNGRKNPHLYTVEAELVNGDFVDKVVQTFGIRTYSVDANKGFILNNEPYRLYGVCKHQEWKQFGPAVSDENLIKDMELIDEIGATALRLSHYQHSNTTYDLSDKKGILTWAEIPFVHDYSGREGKNAKQQLTELITQNYNHPSIFVWGLWNEVRAYNSPDEPCVILTKELNALAHELDKTRITTSASDRGMTSNMGNISDLQAWNKYFGWYYGKYEDMATWLDKFHTKYPDRKIGISEYGIGGNIYHQDRSKLEKPNGNFFPEQEQSYYHELTWKILKDRPYVWGSFIWNMFDFSVAGWNRGGISSLNHKGLVTFDRETKKDAFYFYKANWSEEPVLYIAERRNANRKLQTTIKVYTNLNEAIELHVNGKQVAVQNQKSDVNIMKFENVELSEGKNIIAVFSKGKALKDGVIWTVQK
ncbi:glycoside hydrolase family 2 protein [Flavivirga algicola]|uniref:Beta-galactosidase n=1 Tax=Flavivirga algicola TaxID=2729136 RepID=A0ABX1RVR6_9FLAO|nr:glycoside hydrolase family 2 TIM barrel-domain containing protein [Flavivirga algicola]NMH87642.1 beta-galactosidase [Flavivirga algicola]